MRSVFVSRQQELTRLRGIVEVGEISSLGQVGAVQKERYAPN